MGEEPPFCLTLQIYVLVCGCIHNFIPFTADGTHENNKNFGDQKLELQDNILFVNFSTPKKEKKFTSDRRNNMKRVAFQSKLLEGLIMPAFK